MMTKQSSKTSDVLIGQPPFLVRSRGKKLPPFKRANRIRLGNAERYFFPNSPSTAPSDKKQSPRAKFNGLK